MKSREEKSAGAKNTRKKITKKRPRLNSVQRLVAHIIVVTAFIWFIFGLVMGVRYAPNEDMSPAIHGGDLLFFYRLGRDFQTQDLVVLRKNNTDYVGRIAAGPGDRVEITDAEEVIINGNTLSETGIYASTPRFEGFVDYPVYLGSGEYFILADARGSAEDSRYYGVVTEKEIGGQIILLMRRNGL